ncbi:MAG: helix-turn-helix transcriptional regulator [Candidatus Limnocylindrales bacterium]|jgi:ribosome-binding protein aMBF1 (putative translation factor)
MSNDFSELMASIEAEAGAEGPDGIRRLNELRTRYRLANQLITLRREAKLSQKDLARKTGILQSEISRIERGVTSPNETTWARLAAPLGYELALVPSARKGPVPA